MPTQMIEDPRVFGAYSPRRVGALAGVSGRSIGQWARTGLITPTVFEGRPANLYSFYDVAEAVIVKWLLSQDFSHKVIRDALKDLRADQPQWPLLSEGFGVGRSSVDDRGILVRKDARDVYVSIADDHPEQIVLKPELLDAVRDVLRYGGWLAYDLGLSHIEVEPLKLGGQPTIRGRRWTVDQVARIAADPEGRVVLLEDYELEPVEIDEAVAWEDAAAALA